MNATGRPQASSHFALAKSLHHGLHLTRTSCRLRAGVGPMSWPYLPRPFSLSLTCVVVSEAGSENAAGNGHGRRCKQRPRPGQPQYVRDRLNAVSYEARTSPLPQLKAQPLQSRPRLIELTRRQVRRKKRCQRKQRFEAQLAARGTSIAKP